MQKQLDDISDNSVGYYLNVFICYYNELNLDHDDF